MEPRLEGQTVLVTGGAGFIGRHLVETLVEDNTVRVLDNASTGRPEKLPDEVELLKGDIRDHATVQQATAGVDVIFHQAAIVSVTESVERPEATNDVNLSGTVAVLDEARRQDARVVFASSAAVYGRPETVPIDETHPTEPLSPYGLQKLAADKYLRLYADLYGLEGVALRYFNVYGPGQRGGPYSGVITAFRNRARAGEPLVVDGGGTQTRDFVHVDDVVRANLLAATTDETGEAYNVGTGRGVAIRELAERIIDAAGADVEIRHGLARDGDIPASVADISKASDRLGYEPRVDLDEGLVALLD